MKVDNSRAHSCQSSRPFNDHVADPRLPFFYRPDQEAWGVPTITDDGLPEGWWNDAPLHMASFCPWCGQPL
jgi:hypothetical protein